MPPADLRTPWLPTLLALACSDYNLQPLPDKGGANDTASAAAVGELDGTSLPDEDCFGDEYAPIEVATDESCVGTGGGWDWTVEWELSDFATLPDANVLAYPPLVGQLTDDDGDGDIDADDRPDIVFTTYDANDLGGDRALRVVSGDGGVHAVFAGTEAADGRWLRPTGGSALADVDLDGHPEILTHFYDGENCFAGAITPEGAVEWIDEDAPLPSCGDEPVVADLDGDGSIEVVYGATILSAADGGLIGQGSEGAGVSPSYGFPAPAVADLDGDGVQEIVAGNAIYGPTGETLCTTGYPDGYTAVADLDGNGFGDVVVTGDGGLRVFDHECRLLSAWELYWKGQGGPATIADFDGDGEPEIAVAAVDKVSVYEAGGTLLWSHGTVDHSGATGGAAFDFDGNGRSELVVADEQALWVFSGPDGEVLLQDPKHDSGTCTEYPVVADIDGDGSAEIVVPNAGYGDYGSQKGIYVIGEVNGKWMGARPTWSQYAWSDPVVDDALAPSSSPVPMWPTPNAFRAATALGVPGLDATVLLAGVCTSRCDEGVERVVVRVANTGSQALPAGLRVDLYSRVAGASVWLASATVPEAIPPGQSSAGIPFEVETRYVPDGELTVGVDAANTLAECNEDDNTLSIAEGLCP